MLDCAKCGTGNPVDNKFCKECGERLERVESPAPEVESEPEPLEKIDVAVGQLLYRTFQLYETGKLEEAVASCKNALQLNPDSTSAHSLLGMIYEKKSKIAETEGDHEAAHEFLLCGMRQYQRVIEINPNSIADAEKLRELRAKLRQSWGGPPEPMTFGKAVDLAKQTIRQVPRPILAGSGAALFVLVLLLAIWTRGGDRPTVPDPPAFDASLTPPPRAAQAPQAPPPPVYQYHPQPQLQPVRDLPFTSPEPELPPPQPEPPTEPEPAAQAPREEPTQERTVPPPVRLIPRTIPTLPPSPQVDSQPTERRTDTAAAAPQPAESPRLRGSDLQFQGMELARQGRSQEAISMFRRAIEAYREQIRAGEDVDSANAGIRTCSHYIDMLEN